MDKSSFSSIYGDRGIPEPRFSVGFAQRVVVIAQQKLRRRRLRNRIALTVGMLLLASAPPLVALMHAGHKILAVHDSVPAAQPGWQSEWNEDDLDAYRLAASTAPRSAGDYLLPNAAALTRISSRNDETFWQ